MFVWGCVCERERDGKREVCSVIKWLSNCREPRCVACQIVLPLWPEVSCSGGERVCDCIYVSKCDEFQLPASSLGRLPEHRGPSRPYFILTQRRGEKKKKKTPYIFTFMWFTQLCSPLHHICVHECVCVRVCWMRAFERDDGENCTDSTLAAPQWLALFWCYNQSGHGTWPGDQEVSAALDTGAGLRFTLNPGLGSDRRGV